MPEHTPAPTPSRAVYGFALHLSTKLLFFIYLIWAIVPEEVLRDNDITCFPQRIWAVAVPLFVIAVILLFAFPIYPIMGLLMTPNVDDMRTIRDQAGYERRENGSNIDSCIVDSTLSCSCKDKSKCHASEYGKNCGDFARKSIPPLKDLNIWDVSEHLFIK